MGIKEHLPRFMRRKQPQETGLDRYSVFFDESLTRTQPLFHRATDFLHRDGVNLSDPFDLRSVRLFLALLDAERRISTLKTNDKLDKDLMPVVMKHVRLDLQLLSEQKLPPEQKQRLKNPDYETQAQFAAQKIFDASAETKEIIENRMKHDLVPHMAMLRFIREGKAAQR